MTNEALKAVINGYIYGTMYGEDKDKLVFNEKQEIIEIRMRDIRVDKNRFVYKAGQFADTWIEYKYEDYGKTWSLTRKELENNE